MSLVVRKGVSEPRLVESLIFIVEAWCSMFAIYKWKCFILKKKKNLSGKKKKKHILLVRQDVSDRHHQI